MQVRDMNLELFGEDGSFSGLGIATYSGGIATFSSIDTCFVQFTVSRVEVVGAGSFQHHSDSFYLLSQTLHLQAGTWPPCRKQFVCLLKVPSGHFIHHEKLQCGEARHEAAACATCINYCSMTIFPRFAHFKQSLDATLWKVLAS